MKFLLGFGLLACMALASGHGAVSYANVNQVSGHGLGHGIGHGGYAGYGGHYGGGLGYAGGYGGYGYGGHGGWEGGHGGHHDHHPQYKYEYGVKDAHTGDNKDAWEHRDGDVVKGGYALAEADGTKRVVEYVADGHNGFNAVVKRIGHAVHPQVYGHGGHGYGAGYGAGYGYGLGLEHGYGGHGLGLVYGGHGY